MTGNIRQFILAIVISFYLAIESASSDSSEIKKPPAIVLELDYVPSYVRKRPLKQSFIRV